MNGQDDALRILQLLEAERQTRMGAANTLLGHVAAPPDTSPPVLFNSVEDFLQAFGNLQGQPGLGASPMSFDIIGPRPGLQLDIPPHYGYGEEWDMRGWLNLLSQFKPQGQVPIEALREALRGLSQSRLPVSGGLVGPGSPLPPPPLVPPVPSAPAPLAPPPISEPPADRLFKEIFGDTVFFGNVPPRRRPVW